MAEFNLIPTKYLDMQAKRRIAKTWASIGAIVLLPLVTVMWGVGQHVVEKEDRVLELREERALSMQQHARLTSLKATKDDLQNKARLLQSLRSGAPMTELIATIESAIAAKDVWFVNWKFQRAGIVTKDDTTARSPSYFIMTDDKNKFPSEWHNLTHMTIHGEAKDHAALSSFVKGLFQQPTVEDVRVQRSAQVEHRISFNLAVIVKNPGNRT